MPEREEIYKDAESEKRRCQSAWEDDEKLTAGSKYVTKFTSNSNHMWEDVLGQVNEAAEQFDNPSGL